MTSTAAAGAPDHEAVRATLARYCHLVDDGRFAELADLWTDDATFEVLGRQHRGPAAIAAFMEAAQPPERRGKHVCANSDITVERRGEAGTATARTDYVFVARQPGGGLAITSAGRYTDRLVRDPATGAWRFAARRIDFLA